jgi:hypothetical protein
MRFLVATFLAAQLGACSNHKDAPAAAPTAGSNAAAPAPAAAAPAPSVPDVACKLVTADEAAKLLGHPVKPAEARMAGPVPSCRYKSEEGGASVSVQYYERGEANYEPVRSMMIKEPVDITGAGTKAVRNRDGSLLFVLANGHLGVVIAMAIGKNAGPTAAAADAFAPVLAGRL